MKAFQELLSDKPPGGRLPLTRASRERIIHRAYQGMYRIYLKHAESRHWNADSDFKWTSLRTDLPPQLLAILRGFYAVEQFVPDYTARLANLFRRNYGRSQYQLQWGVEEAKHADVWRNALLFSRAMTADELDSYHSSLRETRWELPWKTPIEMLFYTVLQERATELTYLEIAKITRGAVHSFRNDTDEVLTRVAMAVAIDEAAHYRFFLEGARLYLYYFPEDALDALIRVIKGFEMPAIDLIYDYANFQKALDALDLYSRAKYARLVVFPVLRQLGINHPRLLRGWQESSVPTSQFVSGVEQSVRRLFHRVEKYEAGLGLNEVDPLFFVPVISAETAACT